MIPELLAPAQNLACALTAYKCGADAVYAGIGKFNAREMAENFNLDDLSKLSYYAKSNKKKFYITMNTLIKENELFELQQSIDSIAKLDPDAFIVQDLALVRILRELYPDVEIHASTQMGIHNSSGIDVAKKLGISRVILERQITMDELKDIKSKSNLEIEVFIHGALCASLSGCCLFSSMLGGWSGNRGRCKQPCRRRYHTSDESGKSSGFAFSTKDLSTLDLIPELRKMEINSLKIEGRLRKPDYLESTVTAYRMMLDSTEDNFQKTLKEAKQVLAGSLGRKWTQGFYYAENDKDEKHKIIQYEAMGVSGLLVGSVESANNRGLNLKFSRPVRQGDRLRIQPKSGDEGPSFTCTALSIKNKKIFQTPKGQIVFHPGKFDVTAGSLVFLIGRSITPKIPKNMPFYHRPNIVDIQILIDGKKVVVESINGKFDPFIQDLLLENAEKQPLNQESLKKAFSITQNDQFKLGNLYAEIKGDFFLQSKKLKFLRRNFWEYVIPKLLESKNEESDEKDFESIFEEPIIQNTFCETTVYGKGEMDGIVVSKHNSVNNETNEVILPPFCSEKELNELRENVNELLRSGHKRFRVTSLYQFDLIPNRGVNISLSYPFPITNSLAAAEIKFLNGSKIQSWVELDKEACKAFIGKSPLPIEIYRAGVPAILTTRAKIPVTGTITDSRGKTFVVKESKDQGITQIFPTTKVGFDDFPELSGYYDYSQKPKESNENKSNLNWDHEWV